MPYLRRPAMRQRATTLSGIAALFLATWPAVSNAHNYQRLLTGQWQLTAALDGAQTTSLDEKEAAGLVGRIFTIHKESVKFGDRECGPSEFEAERVEPKLYLPKEFHASAEKLGLPSPSLPSP
jgi:hypothetical protein